MKKTIKTEEVLKHVEFLHKLSLSLLEDANRLQRDDNEGANTKRTIAKIYHTEATEILSKLALMDVIPSSLRVSKASDMISEFYEIY